MLNICSGCGPCVDVCPEVFELNEEKTAVVKPDEVQADYQEVSKEDTDSYPTRAISIGDFYVCWG